MRRWYSVNFGTTCDHSRWQENRRCNRTTVTGAYGFRVSKNSSFGPSSQHDSLSVLDPGGLVLVNDHVLSAYEPLLDATLPTLVSVSPRLLVG